METLIFENNLSKVGPFDSLEEAKGEKQKFLENKSFFDAFVRPVLSSARKIIGFTVNIIKSEKSGP